MGVVAVDQAPIEESRRSNPATYTGAPSNANPEGACPTRNGNGVIYTDLGIIATVAR